MLEMPASCLGDDQSHLSAARPTPVIEHSLMSGDPFGRCCTHQSPIWTDVALDSETQGQHEIEG